MNQRAVGAIHLRIVAIAFAAWIFDFYDLILYSFLLVPVARELHLTPEHRFQFYPNGMRMVPDSESTLREGYDPNPKCE